MPGLPDASVPVIMADLPYGTTKNRWDSILDLDKLWEEYRRLLTPEGVVVLFGQQPFTTTLISSNPAWYRYCWYWIKEKGTGHLNAAKAPLKQVEEIIVFSPKSRHTYNRQMVPRDKPSKHSGAGMSDNYGKYKAIPRTYTHRCPTNVLHFPRDSQLGLRGLHPTQKPVALMEYLVRTYSNAGETILDNVMGSGSTGVAVARVGEGRNFIGMELDEHYFQVAGERINAVTTTLAG